MIIIIIIIQILILIPWRHGFALRGVLSRLRRRAGLRRRGAPAKPPTHSIVNGRTLENRRSPPFVGSLKSSS